MEETFIRREKERSKIRVVWRENLRGLLGIRRMDRGPNTLIRELWEWRSGGGGKIDEVFSYKSVILRAWEMIRL